jgi:hypothetical protein
MTGVGEMEASLAPLHPALQRICCKLGDVLGLFDGRQLAQRCQQWAVVLFRGQQRIELLYRQRHVHGVHLLIGRNRVDHLNGGRPVASRASHFQVCRGYCPVAPPFPKRRCTVSSPVGEIPTDYYVTIITETGLCGKSAVPNQYRLLLELKPFLSEKLQTSIYHLRVVKDTPML